MLDMMERRNRTSSCQGIYAMQQMQSVKYFLKQVVLQGGLPFEVKYPQYKSEVIDAMEEAKAISHDPAPKSYGSFAEALEDMDL